MRNGRIYYRRHYGLLNFLWDAFLTLVSGGLWLIWIFVREMRERG